MENNFEKFKDFFNRTKFYFNRNNYGINQKLQFVMISISIISILSLGGGGYYYGIKLLTEQSYKKLNNISSAKMQSLEKYIKAIENQIITFSEDRMIIDATKEFRINFHAESDNIQSSELIRMESSVKSYYRTNFLNQLNEQSEVDKTISEIWHDDVKATIAQYNYIANNSYAAGLKHYLDQAAGNSAYDKSHLKYHQIIRNYLEKFNYKDIFIIDPQTGHIVYSVLKKIDYATSLLTGPYKNSNLAFGFKNAAKASLKGFVEFSDFQAYSPSFNEPAIFVTSPIFDGANIIGVLAFQIAPDEINSLMTTDKKWAENGLGKTGESYLVGSDNLMRSNSRLFIENSAAYIELQNEINKSKKSDFQLLNYTTTILLQKVNSAPIIAALKGINSEDLIFNYLNNEVFSVCNSFDFGDQRWAVVSEINTSEALEPIKDYLQINSIIGIIVLVLSILFSFRYSKVLTTRITKIKNAIELLVIGGNPGTLSYLNRDEIGRTVTALNQLTDRINKAADFATKIGNRNFNATFEIQGKTDELGFALETMKNSLLNANEDEEKRKIEDEKQNWANKGQSLFGDILRRAGSNLELLGDLTITNLVHYLQANQGGLFVLDEQPDQKSVLKLIASYAYDRRKFLKREIEIGEGLIGMVAHEKKTLYLADIPDDYVNITSGLGKAKPNYLVITPLMVENKTMGIIELANFQPLEQYQKAFIEKVGESIAVSLASAKINQRTNQLLIEAQEKANEMAAQEEEMRQNLEELQATQEALAIKTEELNILKDEENRKRIETEQKLTLSIQNKDAEIQELKKRIEQLENLLN